MYLKILLLSSLMTVNIFSMQTFDIDIVSRTIDDQRADKVLELIHNTYCNLWELHILMHSAESLQKVCNNCESVVFLANEASKDNAEYKKISGSLLRFKENSPIFHAMINEALSFYHNQVQSCGKQMVKLNIAIKNQSILKIEQQSSNAIMNYARIAGIKEKLQKIESLIPKDNE